MIGWPGSDGKRLVGAKRPAGDVVRTDGVGSGLFARYRGCDDQNRAKRLGGQSVRFGGRVWPPSSPLRVICDGL